MSKSAALKKVIVVKKATSKNLKPLKSKKPELKMVKSQSKAKPVAKPAKSNASPKLKAVKTSAKPTAKKPIVDARTLLAKPQTAPAPQAAKQAQRPIIRQTTGFSRPAYKIEQPLEKGKKVDFKVGSYVVYPTHGVGKIVEEETQNIGEHKIKMFVIVFEKDKMTLRVPVARAQAAGLRHIGGTVQMQKMFETLKGRAKTSRGMWSRRAQEYESKINSGNVLLIAEVVRDLHQNVDQAERSYSERMIYESAFGRLAGELAASTKIEVKTASDKLLHLLRSRKAA